MHVCVAHVAACMIRVKVYGYAYGSIFVLVGHVAPIWIVPRRTCMGTHRAASLYRYATSHLYVFEYGSIFLSVRHVASDKALCR